MINIDDTNNKNNNISSINDNNYNNNDSKKIFLTTTITILTITILTLIDYITKKIYHEKEEFVFNKGISFGLLNNIKGIEALIFTIAIIAIIILTFYFLKIIYNIQEVQKPYYQITAITLLLSGIIGNLISRIKYGAVIDFINLKQKIIILPFNFPLFNLADFYITLGVILFIIYFLFLDKSY